MLRRSFLKLSSHRSLRRIPRQITYERPLYYSSRRQFPKSTQSSGSPKLGSASEQAESGSSIPKVAVGGVIVGAASLVAYKGGYLDGYLHKEEKKELEGAKVGVDGKEEKDVDKFLVSSIESSGSSPEVERAEERVNTVSDVPSEVQDVDESRLELKPDKKDVDDASNVVHVEGTNMVQEREIPLDSGSSMSSGEQIDGEMRTKESAPVKQPEGKPGQDLIDRLQVASITSQVDAVPEGIDVQEISPQHENGETRQQHTSSDEVVQEKSLLDEYNLRDNTSMLLNRGDSDKYEDFSEGADVAALEDLKDGYMSKDGKLIFDFLQAIHAAEKRQAELDARTFAEEKRALKEKYEKELKDAIAREFMRAEEAAILDKELKRERAKAASAIGTLQEKAEEKLKRELEQKENEAEIRLKKVEEMAKAEIAAAIAKEKAAQIEKIAEADLNINALCMAFFARSEEARQSHSVHKLALGALALEDSLSKGLPIQKEIEALHPHLKGTDEDSILELVLSSLPEETRNHGTNTFLQLKQKFNDMKEPLRHFSLIPPGGGGLMAHSVAQIASWLRVKESDQSGDGIESLINKVERYLAEGKLAEAADALEEGVKGSHAAAIASDWAKQARNRAFTEQALTFLQAYVTTVSLR